MSRNPHPILVEEVDRRCAWCLGYGAYVWSTAPEKVAHCEKCALPDGSAEVSWTKCYLGCRGTGERQSPPPPAPLRRPPGPLERPLTPEEVILFEDCEQVIQTGRNVFLQVGAALLTVSKNKLYRAQYPTFAAYVKERWGFTRGHAYHLMSGRPLDVYGCRQCRCGGAAQ
jgi:hypothetical protein